MGICITTLRSKRRKYEQRKIEKSESRDYVLKTVTPPPPRHDPVDMESEEEYLSPEVVREALQGIRAALVSVYITLSVWSDSSLYHVIPLFIHTQSWFVIDTGNITRLYRKTEPHVRVFTQWDGLLLTRQIREWITALRSEWNQINTDENDGRVTAVTMESTNRVVDEKWESHRGWFYHIIFEWGDRGIVFRELELVSHEHI